MIPGILKFAPVNGWITWLQKGFMILISLAIAALLAEGYLQIVLRRNKERVHEEELRELLKKYQLLKQNPDLI